MEQIEQTVVGLLTEYKTRNPFELCNELGITVVFPEMATHIKGFYTNLNGIEIIYLNCNLPEWKQRVVCAHELGHALLHQHMNSMFITYHTNLNAGRYENEADYFCACLLLEDEWFQPNSEFSTLKQISAYSGVELRLVEMRAKALMIEK